LVALVFIHSIITIILWLPLMDIIVW